MMELWSVFQQVDVPAMMMDVVAAAVAVPDDERDDVSAQKGIFT